MAGMKTSTLTAACLLALVAGNIAQADSGRKMLQTVLAGSPATITVSAEKPLVNAITITLAIPYPQNAYYCNVTGDSGIPQEGPFPLTVRVPVGVQSTVVFANITGPIPGTSCSAVQQPGSSVIQQPSSVVQQLVDNPSSVVQQSAGASVVQQDYAASVNQQVSDPNAYYDCVGDATTVVQQEGVSSVVQQPSGTSVVQQPSGTSVVQQPSGTSVVQQPSGTSVVQQPSGTSVVQQPGDATSVVQQPGDATSVVQQPGDATSVVQQPGDATSVVQQPEDTSSVVQQPEDTSSVVQQTGRRLLQVGTIEYISNNGSTGQPQLTVLDTVEGVPNISFKPDKAGQVAQFNGALQVAVTTTNDGFGTPYIPYRVDSRLSPQCLVQVNFVGI